MKFLKNENKGRLKPENLNDVMQINLNGPEYLNESDLNEILDMWQLTDFQTWLIFYFNYLRDKLFA